VDSIIALVPEASKMDLDNITYILLRAEYESAKSLVDAYIANKNPAHRNKFRYIFLRMKDKIASEVVDRLEYCEPIVVRDLLNILKESAPEKAHLVTKKLMSHKNAQVRWVALEKFEPGTEVERTDVFKIFKKEKNKEVKKKAASLLLKTKNSEIIKKLFNYTGRNIFHRKFLIQLVELCGHVRAQESLCHLKRIFQKKALFNSKRRDDLRVATVTSLARLQIDEAIELVRSGFHDKSKRVRERAEIIIKLNENMEQKIK
jgi:HEAT repeat protein